MIQSKSKAILLLAIVFLLGIVIGASVGATFLSKRISTRTEPRPPRKEHLVDKFKSRLNLTDQQVGQLKAIFEETGRKYRELYQPLAAQHEALMKEMRGKISQMLTEGQKAEFEKMNKEFEMERPRFGDRPRHGPGPNSTPGAGPNPGPNPVPGAKPK
jgi:uncharacterized membrane-anchored protein YhcB (DUF1043 family)